MSTTSQKITNTLNVQAAKSFVQTVQENASYYVFAAKHTPFTAGSDDNPPQPEDTTLSAIEAYNDMLFGKRVKADQITNMIRRYEWTENTVYDMYTDSDGDLATKQFYVVMDDSVEYNVYKCLYNNNGAKSTQRPLGKDTTPIEFPQDGYIWKYMFTIDQFDIRKFATADYVPVTPSSVVQQAAVPGSIEIITVDNSASGYNNFTTGNFPFSTDIAINGNFLEYGLDSNASNVDTFYNNCIIKITSGSATGEYRVITNYVIRNSKKVITIDRAFTSNIAAGDEYEIYPNVFVYDLSGTSTVNCAARAIVNTSTGNAISRIEVLNPGAGYRLATARIKQSNAVPVISDNIVITPIVSPPGGHGADPANELFARFVGITTSFVGNSMPLVASNDYRTIGILKDPQYANVNIVLDTTSIKGSFIPGENVLRYRPIRVFGNVNIFANSLVVGTDTTFIDSFRTDDRLIITNGVSNVLANIHSIASDTELTIDKEPLFTGSNCALYIIESELFGKVTDYNSFSVTCTNVKPVGLSLSSFLLGETSFCSASVSNTQPYVTVNGRDADEFSAFNQLTTFVGTFTTPEPFQEDERIIQDFGDDDINPAARVHSWTDNAGSSNDFVYATNINNIFVTTEDGGTGVIKGTLTDAYFTARYKYNGEIIPDSGEILYLENVKPITRQPKQTETIKLILEF